jgi:hypothetical protein
MDRWIRILLSSSKNSKKYIDSYFLSFLWLLHDFLSLKNDVNIPLKSKKQKKLRKNYVHVLKVTDFFVLQGANLALSSAKKSHKQGSAATATPHSRAGGRAAVGGKDQSLVLFHGLGKVLYAKRASNGPPEPCPFPAALERHRRLPLLADPEQVLENTPIRCVAILVYASQCFKLGDLDQVLWIRKK